MPLTILPSILLTTEDTLESAGITSSGRTAAEPEFPTAHGSPGYRHSAPENTLPAFKLAKAASVGLIELDYHHSQDGVPVFIHDEELDSTIDAMAKCEESKIRAAGKTLKELHSLDAGHWSEAKYPHARLTSLAEALDFIQDGNVTHIERKDGAGLGRRGNQSRTIFR